MNSIRSYLTIRLLAGFVLLLSVASILIYFISKNILESDFDRRLFAKAQAIIASTSQTGERIELDWSNLPQEIGPHGKRQELLEIVNERGKTPHSESGLHAVRRRRGRGSSNYSRQD